MNVNCRLLLKCDGTRAETGFRLSAKWTSPFKTTGASVQSTTGSRGVRISGSNAGYTMFRGCVNGTGYPLHSPVSTSLPRPCVTVCHHISTGLYTPCNCYMFRPLMRVSSGWCVTKERYFELSQTFVIQCTDVNHKVLKSAWLMHNKVKNQDKSLVINMRNTLFWLITQPVLVIPYLTLI